MVKIKEKKVVLTLGCLCSKVSKTYIEHNQVKSYEFS